MYIKMLKNVILCCIIFFVVLSPLSVNGYIVDDILPKGRIRITDFDVPDAVNAGEGFSVNVTIKNERFLPTRLMLRVDLLDGMLELIKKDIGEEPSFIFSGKTSKTIQIYCIIREGDVDWYKEEYNIRTVLFQKIPIIGWISRSVSTVQGIHVKSKLYEKDKVRILNVRAPESIDKDTSTFDVNVLVSNEGSFDMSAWVSIKMVEKRSVIPELEQFSLLDGFSSKYKELGRSKEQMIKIGEIKEFIVNCNLRETEENKEQFDIEAFLFINISGQHYSVDTSSIQGIYHEQPFLEQNYPWIIIAGFGALIALFLIVLIIRILYPAYYIKRIKLKEEKRRIDKRKF